MRIVFMGTPDFAANILMELKEQHDVIAVYTRPDAVRGRGKALLASPVKKVALEAGIDVFEPKTLRSEEEVARLRNLAPDAICVAAYGMILPQEVLDIPSVRLLERSRVPSAEIQGAQLRIGHARFWPGERRGGYLHHEDGGRPGYGRLLHQPFSAKSAICQDDSISPTNLPTRGRARSCPLCMR